MPDPRVITMSELSEPVIDISPYYPGRFASRPDKSFVPANGPELALNQATDNFRRQMDYNYNILETVKRLNGRQNVFRNSLIGFGIFLGLMLLVIVLRF